MAERARKAYANWHAADTAARKAESRLLAAWIAHDMGGGPPSEELVAEVRRLRAIADERLTEAVQALSLSGERKP